MLNWRGQGQSAMGICAFCYMKLLWCTGFPVIYAQLEEGWGPICHGYMCIVLYLKLIWCSDFPENYAQLDREVSNCHRYMCIVHRYMCIVLYIYRSAIRCAKFGVAVFKASMLDWRRRAICHGYMCIVLYMKLIWCNGFAEIYV